MKKKPIEAAWQGYRSVVVPKDAGEVQLKETRQAFYAGAAVLFTAIMTNLSDGDDASPSDEHMLAAIQAELDEYGQSLDLEVLKPKTH